MKFENYSNECRGTGKRNKQKTKTARTGQAKYCAYLINSNIFKFIMFWLSRSVFPIKLWVAFNFASLL